MGHGAYGKKSVLEIAGMLFQGKDNIGGGYITNRDDVHYLTYGIVCSIRAFRMFTYDVENVRDAGGRKQTGEHVVFTAL